VSADRTVRIWTLSSSPATHTILSIEADNAQSGTGITALSVSPEGLHAAIGTSAGTIRIWDLKTRAPIAEWAAHADQIYSIRWTRAGLVSGGLDKTMKWWDLKVTDTFETRGARTMPHTNYVLSAASVQHGLMKRGVTGSLDGKLQMWDLKSGELLFCVMGHRNSGQFQSSFHPNDFLTPRLSDSRRPEPRRGLYRIWQRRRRRAYLCVIFVKH
jgi:WD40 repeat protein